MEVLFSTNSSVSKHVIIVRVDYSNASVTAWEYEQYFAVPAV
ncbi:hypothetical protein [Cohnella lupini]